MRFKYYIRGFGLGIIFTTIILMVAFKLHGGMTNEQIKKEAAKLGMVEANSIGTDTDKKDSESEHLSEPSQQIEPTQQPEPTPEPTQQPEPTPTPNEPSNPLGDVFRLEIENGDNCRIIGQKLVDGGVITSVDEFRSYMNNHYVGNRTYATSFKVGIYAIPKNASYEDIARITIPGVN